MIRAHRIRLNPSAEQAGYFERCASIARFTWNWALAEYNNALARGEKPSLAALKKEFNRRRATEGFAPFVGEVQSYAYQYAFQDLQAALSRYHELRKAGRLKPPAGWKGRKDNKPFGWPRFKSRNKTTPAFGLANNGGMRFEGHWVHIQRCPGGPVNMTELLRFEGKVLGGRVSRRAGSWYLAVQIEIPDHEKPQPPLGAVGVDFGVKQLAVTSDGTVYENPRALGRNMQKLKRISRQLSRRQEGSSNWRKTQKKIARLHARIANIRREHIHIMTSELAGQYQVIGIEDLNISGMMRNRSLAGAIGDTGMRMARTQLEYKAPGRVVVVDRWYPSSKTCNACGAVLGELSLSQREWICPTCGVVHDRDLNAARNIRDAALRPKSN